MSGQHAYTEVMEVTVTNLRAELAAWLARARDGQEVVVTERGLPIVRMVAAGAPTAMERLVQEGVVTPAAAPRRTRATAADRVRARDSVSDLVSEQRR